ncbi:MAG: ATP-binding domain-containing protein, partial [Tannerella sp.]|nr:ATP-binding domain-containing protein [Tannerella sp.]
MEFIVYTTKKCKEEAETHNFVSALESLEGDIEKKQSIAMFQPFPASLFVKKKFGSFQGRLIAAQEIVKVDDHDYAVMKLLGVLIRGTKDYESFSDNAQKNGEKYLRRVNTETIKQFVSERIESNPPEKKKSLSEEEKAFVYSSNSDYSLKNESLIYESKKWIAAINQKPFADQKNRIHDTIEHLLDGKYPEKRCVEIEGQPNLKIICFQVQNEKHIFLADLYNAQDENTNPNEIIQNWGKEWENSEISKLARRAYPQYLILDEELWYDIEKDAQSNLTLSGEEIEVLTSISKDYAFPLFINGRAGSGKSTILQYLFAEYFSRYLSYHESVPPPVYFTYNKELLKQAHNSVSGLFKTNSNFVEPDKKVDDFDQRLNSSFKELRNYLLSLVNEKDKYLPHNYVSYSVFTALWNEKFKTDKTAIKEYPPDVSWHIIRTYIEGINQDDYLEPDEYDLLEKDQKTVSKETYTKVYDVVWKWYCNDKKEKNRWDDQDLVRFIIESNLAKPEFSGIFCDEAQDFTRIEMEVICRLSIFSDRDIPSPTFVSKIPFAFAGDELQTLNPSGFRWDALTALFSEKFFLSVYPDNTKIPLNFRELKNNYRSSPPIVNFCNMLQLFRAQRFGISGLLPQKPWENDENSATVVRFEPNSAAFWQGIRQKNDTVFIIPCNEEEEPAWIRNDPDLRENIKMSNDTPDIPVLSANLSKGLEFNRVVAWKFGGQPGIDRLLNPMENEDAAQRLPLEYHINKTYVAISRAKKKLYIVDDDDGINKLWQVTKNDQLIHTYLSDINKSKENWSVDNLASYFEGTEKDFSDDEQINTEDIAKSFMEQGLATKSAFILRQAALNYMKRDNKQLAAKCEGVANIINNNYIAAGDEFSKGGWIDFAINSYWLGNKFNPDDVTGFKKIIEIANEEYKQTFYYIFASVIIDVNQSTISWCLDFISKLRKDDVEKRLINEDWYPVNLFYESLNNSINKIVELVIKKGFSSKNFLEILISACENGIADISAECLAEMAFELKEYKMAVDYWEKSPNRNEKNYKFASMRIKDFPENIKFLYELKEYEKIAGQFLDFKGELTGEDLVIAVKALFITKRSEDAFKHIVNFTKSEYFNSTLKECESYISSQDKKILTVCHKIAQIAGENWTQILNIISDAKSNEINAVYIAAAIARTKSLPEQQPSVQRSVSDYLKKEIINKFNDVPSSMIFDAGTAIEKAGRRIDVLKFYEYAVNHFQGNQEKVILCEERWINAKELQVKINNGGEKWASERLQEARNKRQAYNIENKPLDEFIEFNDWTNLYKFIIQQESNYVARGEEKPELNIKTATAETKQNFEFNFEGYRFCYYKKHKRLNITNDDDG